ncbi:MAG: hypothetical protein VKL39_22460 [Leptolyngbyaceae bacterium]|nr:hypothetical protein [Leptolyngbyaceae bacterium]
MMVNQYPLNRSLQNSQSIKDSFREFLKAFWKFSVFYGQYHSTPLDKRHEVMDSYSRQHEHST